MEDYDVHNSSDESRDSPEAKGPTETTSQTTDLPVNNQFVVEVNGLTRSVNAEHLKEIFGVYGKIQKAEHVVCPFRKILTGFGLINYEDAAAVEKAIDYLDKTQLDGKYLYVKKYDGRDLSAKARRIHEQNERNAALDNKMSITIQPPKQEDLRKKLEDKKSIEPIAFPGIRTVVQVEPQVKKDTIRIKSPERRLSVEPPPTEKKRISPPRNRRSPERRRSRSPERSEIKSTRKERSQSPNHKKPAIKKKSSFSSSSRSSSNSPARKAPMNRSKSPPVVRRGGSPDRRPIRRSPDKSVSPDRRRASPIRRSPDRRQPYRRPSPERRPYRGGPPSRRGNSPDRRRTSPIRRSPDRRSPDRRQPYRRASPERRPYRGSPKRVSRSPSPIPKRRRSYSSSEDSPKRNKK
jgi:hypothetical protein